MNAIQQFFLSHHDDHFVLALGWGIGTFTFINVIIRWTYRHARPEAIEGLRSWLEGKYDVMDMKGQWRWYQQYLSLFNRIYGEKLCSWKRVERSILFSLVFTVALFFILTGFELKRVDGDLSWGSVFLIALAVNVPADYLSIQQTRFTLSLLGRWPHAGIFACIGILILDIVATGLIIWGAISLYRLVFGLEALSVTELLALFSIYAVFFYSTFLTSIGAWIFAGTAFVMAIFNRLGLKHFLNIVKAPARYFAMISGALVALPVFFLALIIQAPDEDTFSQFDSWICEVDPANTCDDLARMTQNQQQARALMARSCLHGNEKKCKAVIYDYFNNDPAQAVTFFSSRCKQGDFETCAILGYMYDEAIGVSQDYIAARQFYHQACEDGNMMGCNNLGRMHQQALGGPQDLDAARRLYHKACENGVGLGCLLRDDLML